MPKARSNQERSIDPAAQQMLARAEELGITTSFTRVEQMAACPIGVGSEAGICCKNCFMGPCRLTKDGQVGIVGYEINFNRYFYKYTPPRPLEAIENDIRAVERDIMRMLAEVSESGSGDV